MSEKSTLTQHDLEGDGVRTERKTPTTAGLWKKFYKDTLKAHPLDTGSVSNPFADRETAVEPPRTGERLPHDLAQRLSAAERPSPIAAFHKLQEWDGYVLDVRADSFIARITDLSGQDQPDGEEVVIPLDELDEQNRALLEPGRLFRWSIGYERSRTGQKTRISRIIVRQMPAWSKGDLGKARDRAANLAKALQWD